MYNLLGIDDPYDDTCKKKQDKEALLIKSQSKLFFTKTKGIIQDRPKPKEMEVVHKI
jgi:hypothetical protein